MAKKKEHQEEEPIESPIIEGVQDTDEEEVLTLKGMYKDYFLDYASYVVLERAVPSIYDGLKPVQRRLLHALKEIDDGRFHKVANVIGQTMQFHPHGDASIGDALVNMGQKDLLIDTQGNWGNIFTGDGAAASRYIETRLTKFALDVAFNPQTTQWQLSYDGRKKEPINLPMKFPMVLAQGTDGIAVGLSTKILPHNFIELLEASILVLKNKPFVIYPDFLTGGLIDVTEYNRGQRGGKVKIRARIEIVDKTTLAIRDIPYGVNTVGLIESIIKANDKGKIKIKKIVDNTAKDVEIMLELIPGTSPDVTLDALYAFTDCQISVSPNACVIVDDKPHFLTVDDILRFNTLRTRDLLYRELEIKRGELEEKLHFASLEKIFIEKRIYRDIEECETWEQVLDVILVGLKKYVRTPSDAAAKADDRLLLRRDITQDDIARLTEIKIKRISKYNTFQADELIARLEEELKQVNHDLEHIVAFTIAYFERLLQKYGKGRERKTQIAAFDTIAVAAVAANNAKLYVNREEGFIGWGLKKDEFVCDCSDLDEIIVFRKDGKFIVSKIADKQFVGKDIMHVAVWKKADERTTYNLVYLDGSNGRSMAKRFNVTAITRDREYAIGSEAKGSKILYFSANPNGEAEVLTVQLTQSSTAKKKIFDFDFSEIAIKGRASMGNILTRYPVRKVSLKEAGKSTLGAQELWLDDATGRLNKEGRGKSVGAFDTGDVLLLIYKEGTYELMEPDFNKRFNPDEIMYIAIYDDDETVVNAIYYEGERTWTIAKRFKLEAKQTGQRYSFIGDHKQSALLFVSLDENPGISYITKDKKEVKEHTLHLADFIDVKGWKALGNRVADQKIAQIKPIEILPDATQEETEAEETEQEMESDDTIADKLQAGDSIEFDVNGQGKLF